MLNVATYTTQLPEFIGGHKLDEIQDVEQISHNLNPTEYKTQASLWWLSRCGKVGFTRPLFYYYSPACVTRNLT